MQNILFATDLDGTLVGDEASLVEFNSVIRKLREQSNFKLVYVTARSLESYKRLELGGQLLSPDALITSLGTEIYAGDALSKVNDWPRLVNWRSDSVRTALCTVDGLIDQPMAEQNDYKISYYLQDGDTFERAKEALRDLSVEAMYSGTRYLDILPKGTHKGSAVKYMADIWGIDLANVISAGDSPNDIAMLEDYKSIIVGNAQQLLLDWATTNDHGETYLAQGQHAAGVIEGLRYYQVAGFGL